MNGVLKFAVEENLFAIVFWSLVTVGGAGCLAVMVRAARARGKAWWRAVRAAAAWVRLRAVLRWRRTRWGAERYARRVVAELDLDVEFIVLQADPRYTDPHGRCCGEPYDTSTWLDPHNGGEGGN